MNIKLLESISVISFVVFILTVIISLTINEPMSFNIVGKLYMFIFVVSMLGTIVPLMLIKDKDR